MRPPRTAQSQILFANSDIFFDSSLDYFTKISDKVFDSTFYAITRLDLDPGVGLTYMPLDSYGSSDTWVFKPRAICEDKVKLQMIVSNLNYTLGHLGGENRMLYEINRQYPNLNWLELRQVQTRSANLELKVDEGGYDTTMDAAQLIAVTNEAKRLEDRVSKFQSLVKRLEASQPARRSDTYKVIDVAMEFLEAFHSQSKNIHGTAIDKICHRLLPQAVLEEGPRTRLEHAIQDTPAQNLNWEVCEFLFINTLMTDSEKELEVRMTIARGIKAGESYERYAWRLQSLVKVYKVGASSMHAVTLRQMVLSIPPMVFDAMKARVIQDLIIEGCARNMMPLIPEEKNIIDSAARFCKYLEKMTGPEDCDDRTRHRFSILDGVDQKSNKRAKHDVDEGSSAVFDCKNGCGKNPTHDTNGCRICGKCKQRGHIAADCS
ncbi:unnamed protein product [Mortierella alpina]